MIKSPEIDSQGIPNVSVVRHEDNLIASIHSLIPWQETIYLLQHVIYDYHHISSCKGTLLHKILVQLPYSPKVVIVREVKAAALGVLPPDRKKGPDFLELTLLGILY